MRSYQESVVNQIKQMIKDKHQLIWFKNRHDKDEMTQKALENSNCILREKLHKSNEEKQILRLRAKKQYEEVKEEVMLSNADEFYILVGRLLLVFFELVDVLHILIRPNYRSAWCACSYVCF